MGLDVSVLLVPSYFQLFQSRENSPQSQEFAGHAKQGKHLSWGQWNSRMALQGAAGIGGRLQQFPGEKTAL